MARFLVALSILPALATSSLAEDTKPNGSKTKSVVAPESEAAKPTAESLRANPNDAKAMRTFVVDRLRTISALTMAKPDEAEKALNSLKGVLDSLEPEAAEAADLLGKAKAATRTYARRIELARLSPEDALKALRKTPDEPKAILNYISKMSSEVGSRALVEPDEAEKILKAARKELETVAAGSENPSTKLLVERGLESLGRYTDRIADGRKMQALIGTDAVALDIEDWSNGAPLTADDLKGKVVMLDFWAVWCGPCISTFPHLREWQEKYADKGLVMIGLTRYYDYAWDEEAGRAKNSDEDVPHDVERAMLEKFAQQYKLQHRFAIQADRTISDHYAVRGIPHVVLIDRRGTVRLIRVGGGPANAKAIGEMLETLIKEEA